MIGARKVVRRAFGLMVPRTSQKMRRNEVYRWTNRLVWLVIGHSRSTLPASTSFAAS